MTATVNPSPPPEAAEMLDAGQEAANLIAMSAEALRQMMFGQVASEHARMIFHQLEGGIALCHTCADKPEWAQGRESFVAFAEQMAELRDVAREMF